MGYKLSKCYDINSDYDEMYHEFEIIKNQSQQKLFYQIWNKKYGIENIVGNVFNRKLNDQILNSNKLAKKSELYNNTNTNVDTNLHTDVSDNTN